MKRKIVIFMMMFIMLVGCTSNEISGVSPTPSQLEISSNSPGEIIVLLPQTLYGTPDVGFVWEWQEYIRNKYDLEIELKYVDQIRYLSSVDPSNHKSLGTDLSDVRRNSDDGGFIYIEYAEDLKALVESGLIVPVNEYINLIPSLSVLDSELFEQFADSNDNIWALPLSQNMSGTFRFYNNAWLKSWGKELPITTDEFLEYAYYIKDNDPDGNGEKDSYIQAFNEILFLREFDDILKAFGCYSDNGNPIGYNPLTDQYEITLLSESFTEAFVYIKNLYDEGLITKTETNFYQRGEEPYNVATAHMYAISSFKDPEVLILGHYMTGTNKTKLIKYKSGITCMAVLAGTEQVAWKMDYFLNKAMEEPDFYIDFYSGIKEKTYFEYDDYYTWTYYDDNGNKMPQIDISLNVVTDKYVRKPMYFYARESEVDETDIRIRLERNKIMAALNPGKIDIYSTDLGYSVSYLTNDWVISEINENLRSLTTETIVEMLEGLVSIEDGIEQYKTKVKSMGILDKLGVIN